MYKKLNEQQEQEIKMRAIHTIEYLRSEVISLKRFKDSLEDRTAAEDELLKAFKEVLQFVEDCNEDYLEECSEDYYAEL